MGSVLDARQDSLHKAQRVERRISTATTNDLLVLAAAIATLSVGPTRYMAELSIIRFGDELPPEVVDQLRGRMAAYEFVVSHHVTMMFQVAYQHVDIDLATRCHPMKDDRDGNTCRSPT